MCHRFGLLPIKADPRLFEMPLTRVVGINESGVDCDEEPPGDPKRFGTLSRICQYWLSLVCPPIGLWSEKIWFHSYFPGNHFRNLIFEINVKCTKKPAALKAATDPREIYDNAFIYTKSFKWIPIGNQSTSLPYQPAMVHDDILVAQLRPGQEIEARCVVTFTH